MYLAMHNWMRPEPIELAVKRMVKFGFSAIEISGEPEKYDVKEVRAALTKHNIKCFGSISMMSSGRSLLAKDEAARAKTVEYIKGCLTFVDEVGGQAMGIVPSEVGKVVPDATPDEEWKWALESFSEIYEHAEKCGVRVGIEPLNRFETYFINRGEQALALAEAVGPNCGVCLDAYHMNIEESDCVAAIKKVGDRLVNFHVASNDRMGAGMGHIDWVKIVNALKGINYSGPLLLECLPVFDRTPANPYPEAADENPPYITEDEKAYMKKIGSSAMSEPFYEMLMKKTADTLLPLIK